ncbi:MFS general substrate transporter [Martensiomyces pterosporus]|nr:MFS general substrate transporter [Martensiomyces pterosporus]
MASEKADYEQEESGGDIRPSSPSSEASDSEPRWWESKSLEDQPVDSARGWIVAIAGSFMLMFSMGCVNSYGSYQTYYHMNQFPKEPMSTLSWIGTLQFAVMNFVGIPAGILCERMDSRLVTFSGGLIMGIALIIASFCDSAVWKLLVTQGIVFSIGASLVFIPATSIPSQWFVKYRALAIGVVVAGSGIGGLWLTPATDHMISSLGTAWALRITGIVIIAVNSVASLFMRNRLKVRGRDKIVDFSVFRDIRFLFIFAGGICGTTAYFTPFFSMPSFAIQIVGKNNSFGTNLVTIINAASTLGRIITGQVAMQFGNINTLATCTLVASLSILILWLPFHTTGTLVACAIIYGLFCGGFISLLPVILAELWGVSRIATIIGLLYIANFIGTMVGAPSSSAILDNVGHGHNFKPTIAFSGVFMMGAFLFFTCLRFAACKSVFKKV